MRYVMNLATGVESPLLTVGSSLKGMEQGALA